MKQFILALVFCASLFGSAFAQGGMGPGPGTVHSIGGGGGPVALDGTPQCTTAVIGTSAACNFVVGADQPGLGGGVTTFTVGLPVTTGNPDVVVVCANGQVFVPTGISDNSGVTGSWTIVTQGNNICAYAVATGTIGSGKKATITMSGGNDNTAAVSLAVSGINSGTPLCGSAQTGTTSTLTFTTSASCFILAFYQTSAGSTDAGGGSWGSRNGGQVGGSPAIAGDPGIANSNMFGYVLEWQITTASSLVATLTGGTPTSGIGLAINP